MCRRNFWRAEKNNYHCRFVITALHIQLQPCFSTDSIEPCTSTVYILSPLANAFVVRCDTYEFRQCLTGQMIRGIRSWCRCEAVNTFFSLSLAAFASISHSHALMWSGLLFVMRYTTPRTLLSHRKFMALFFVSLFMIIVCVCVFGRVHSESVGSLHAASSRTNRIRAMSK